MGAEGPDREQGDGPIGLEAAQDLVRRHIEPLEAEEVPLLDAPGRVLAREVPARTDSPSADVSLKDGYAVRSEDTVRASRQSPARLRVLGSRFAGERGETKTRPEGCVKITSGAILPEDADAVVGIEFCRETSEGILVSEPVAPGLNVLAQGTDIAAGAALGHQGTGSAREPPAGWPLPGWKGFRSTGCPRWPWLRPGMKWLPRGRPSSGASSMRATSLPCLPGSVRLGSLRTSRSCRTGAMI